MVPASVRVRREDASSAGRIVAAAGGVKGRPTVGPGFGLAPTLSTSRSLPRLSLSTCRCMGACFSLVAVLYMSS